MLYNWTIPRKLILAGATGVVWYHIVWISLFLAMPSVLDILQIFFEEPPTFFLSRVYFLIFYAALFVITPFFFPGLFILPTWLFTLLYFSFHLGMIVTDIFFNIDILVSRAILIRAGYLFLLLVSLFALSRPALFYTKVLWIKAKGTLRLKK